MFIGSFVGQAAIILAKQCLSTAPNLLWVLFFGASVFASFYCAPVLTMNLSRSESRNFQRQMRRACASFPGGGAAYGCRRQFPLRLCQAKCSSLPSKCSSLSRCSSCWDLWSRRRGSPSVCCRRRGRKTSHCRSCCSKRVHSDWLKRGSSPWPASYTTPTCHQASLDASNSRSYAPLSFRSRPSLPLNLSQLPV